MKIHRLLGHSDLLGKLVTKIDGLSVLEPSQSLCDKVSDLEFLKSLITPFHVREKLPEHFTDKFIVDERIHMLFTCSAIDVFHQILFFDLTLFLFR